MNKNIVVAVTGASGAVFGIRSLQAISEKKEYTTHLIITKAARMTITMETDWCVADVESLADIVYHPDNIGASIASGSFHSQGMLIAPCSIKTLSAIAYSYTAELVSRAADVHLKEGRPIVLLVRETPLHCGHLKLLLRSAENGAVIMPPIPSFYHRPKTIDDIVNDTVGRALARLGIENDLYCRWEGMD